MYDHRLSPPEPTAQEQRFIDLANAVITTCYRVTRGTSTILEFEPSGDIRCGTMRVAIDVGTEGAIGELAEDLRLLLAGLDAEIAKNGR